MSKPVRLTLPAEQEMFCAARFYQLEAPGLGHDFLDKIELAIQGLAEAPERWPLVDINIRRCMLRRFPYSLLYRVDVEEIVILAVMHQRRHPTYWLSRVT